TKLESAKHSRTGLIFRPEPHIIHIPKKVQIQQDYYMFFQGEGSLFWKREQYVREQLIMNEKAAFVDVGANVGSYSLRIARDYAHIGVRVVAIEAEPEAYTGLGSKYQA
ncbi:MAG: hypothetical protein WA667_05910, partial [Candidatus Nitrosopolaris sp.]